MGCSLDLELECLAAGARVVAGLDEAGRGCLAGPVHAAAVILPADFFHPILNDSKQLTARQRERLFEELSAHPGISIGCGMATVREIERLNILRASHLAMQRAVEALPHVPDTCLVDGLPIKNFPFVHRGVVSGDALSFSIAAASIVAKVTRDRFMCDLAVTFPHYGFEKHKGYGTAEHLAALDRHGPCEHHRATFGPVAQLTLALD